MKKKILLLITILYTLTFTINCNATINTYDRKVLPNYGVNKNWNITEKDMNFILNTKAVNANEKVYDYSNLLTKDEEKSLKLEIDKFVKKTGLDVVILTDSLEYKDTDSVKRYAVNFYDYNDFGMNNRNSGILLFRNTYKDEPYMDIYSFGYAQLFITKDRISSTLDNIFPSIDEGKTMVGLERFISDLNLYYDNGIPRYMKDYYVDELGYLRKDFIVPWLPMIVTGLFISISVVLFLIKRSKIEKKQYQAKDYLNKKSVKITAKKDVFIVSKTTKQMDYSINKDLTPKIKIK